jgi:lysophospholipase L1-like esterase
MRSQPVRRALFVTLASLVAAAAVFLAIRPAQSAALPARIMALGDSITGSPGCWRALLYSRLQAGGFTNIDFVGTQAPQGCSVPYDGEHEGHGGALVTAVADQNQLPGWLSASRPNVVLMHFGTNDVWSNRSVPVILAAYSKLVDQMRASEPTMRILVAQIIPMAASACGECPARVVALNNAIPGWAAGKSTAQSPIVVVDQWTGFNTTTDTYDGVHPNEAGNVKISNRWYPALTAVLNATPPTATPTTSAPSPSSSPVPPSASPIPPTQPTGGVCAATYRIVGQWTGGFQGEVVVTNTGPSAITRWTTRFTLASGQTISQSWNTALTQTGSAVVASNVSYNGALARGATATFGFLSSWTGSNPIPVTTCQV